MDQSFPKTFRLLKREEFKRVYSRGKRVVGRYVLVHALPNSLGHPRLGITVTRKSGKAVVRNRWKRLVREVFRRNKAAFPPVDMVVTVKRGARLPTYWELEKDLLTLARRL
jgi:ribonuclease P protein component